MKNSFVRNAKSFFWILTLMFIFTSSKKIQKTKTEKIATPIKKDSKINKPSSPPKTQTSIKKPDSNPQTPIPDSPFMKYDYSIDGKIEQIVICGKNFDHLLVLTSKQDLFHTTDFGKNWIQKTSELNELHSSQKLHIVSLYQHPKDQEKVIMFDKSGEHLLTKDCGMTYNRLVGSDHNLTAILFHPTNSSILAAVNTKKNLLISLDAGINWKTIKQGVVDFIFAKYSEEAFFSAKNRIIVLEEFYSTHGVFMPRMTFSDDFFSTSTIMLENVEKFTITRCCIFVKQIDADWRVADAFGWSYTFYKTLLFDKDIRHIENLNILDNDITWYPMASLEYFHKNIQLNKLAKTDFWGTNFEVLEQNLVCQTQLGTCDFFPAHGLSGVMILNRFDPEYINFAVSIPQFISQNSNPVLNYENYLDFRQTLISFNFGEKFSPINPPTRDVDGNQINCSGCFLHLHLSSSKGKYELPKANLDAPGVILASGSIGKYLSEEEDGNANIGLYISFNAGHSWQMLAKGRFVFEVLDQGSLIVFAPIMTLTSTIFYTLDSGETVKTLSIASTSVIITSISVQEKQFLRKFIVHAKLQTDRGWQYKILTVDFSNLVEKECVLNKNNQELSDYMEWSPSSDNKSNCWNGREAIILIKKPHSKCFNPPNFITYYVKKYCECQESDFHCDYGYQKNDNQKCVKIDGMSGTSEIPSVCPGTYSVSSGYVKNLETFCTGGVDYKPIVKTCPKGYLSSIWALIWLLLKVVFGLGVLYYVWEQKYFSFLTEITEKVNHKIKNLKQERTLKSTVYCELKKNDGFTEAPKVPNGYSELKKDLNSIFEDDDDENGKIQM